MSKPVHCLSLLVFWLAIPACSFVRAPTPEELALLDNPPEAIKTKQNTYTPLILSWMTYTELRLRPEGRTLTVKELDIARKLGVARPERVRVLVLDTFPLPSDPELCNLPAVKEFGRPEVGGLTLGHLILLKPRFSKRRWILAHELMHVVQQERMGKFAFVNRYIAEHELMNGRMPLELEAHKPALEYWPW